MSVLDVVAEGALRAAQLVPLLFVFNAALPAQAQETSQAPLQPSPVVADAAPIVVLDPTAPALTLAASRVDILVSAPGAKDNAEVRTRLTYRNDGALPVEARYTLPLGSRVAATLEELDLLDAHECGGADDATEDHTQLVAAEAPAAMPAARGFDHGTVLLGPGEEATIETRRDATVLRKHGHYRVVLPLSGMTNASVAPRFAGSVTIDAPVAVQSLVSATHGGKVSGLGTEQAQLALADGTLRAGEFLSIEFALDDGLEKAEERFAQWAAYTVPKVARIKSVAAPPAAQCAQWWGREVIALAAVAQQPAAALALR
jgi:hypothetical protein